MTVVVQNGEIYNYRELRDELRSRGHSFSTDSDTEVLVHLYEEHGDDLVHHLRGMFAFALWDARRRRLLLGRDRLGKKPLFYAVRNGTLWFGSEAKAILQDPAVPREVDLEAIDCFLHFQYVPDPLCAFSGLSKLEPGHLLVWEQGRARATRYWKLHYQPKLELPDEELRELIRERLLEATRLRLRSDVPLGALLSGGVDSSAVVAAMARTASGPVKTFSVGFDHDAFDETAYAREVAARYETDHHELRVEPAAIGLLPRIVWHYGEPFADPSAIPSFLLAEETRRHVTVALNGDGGDEAFAGYSRYVLTERANRLGWVPKGLWSAASGLLARGGAAPNTAAWPSRMRRALDLMAVDPWRRYANYVAFFKPEHRRRLYTAEFLRAVGDTPAMAVVERPYAASDAEDETERLVDVDVQTYLPGDLLVKMDIATMAHSLEVRSPLLDQDLVETAAALPKHAKLRGGATKRIFKQAMRPWLPESVLERKKMGFGVPIDDWLRGPLREVPAQILLDQRSIGREIFRETAVRQLIDDHTSGLADNGNRIWALLQLELWQRTYIDQSQPSPVALDPELVPAGSGANGSLTMGPA